MSWLTCLKKRTTSFQVTFISGVEAGPGALALLITLGATSLASDAKTLSRTQPVMSRENFHCP
jgi:hypothetical protein